MAAEALLAPKDLGAHWAFRISSRFEKRHIYPGGYVDTEKGKQVGQKKERDNYLRVISPSHILPSIPNKIVP
jgi:hypothetical protein